MTPEEQAAADKAKADAEAKIKADQEAAAAKLAELEKDPIVAQHLAELRAKAKAADDYKTDLFKNKEALKAAAEEKAKAEAESHAKHVAELAAAGKYKELYEASEKRAAELEEKRKREAAGFIQDLRHSEVTRAALAAGLLPAAQADLAVLDMSAVEASRAESGVITFNNTQSFVEQLKAQRPHWFGTAKAPNINGTPPGAGGGAGNGGKTLTAEQVLELEAKDPAAYRAYMKGLMTPKAGA